MIGQCSLLTRPLLTGAENLVPVGSGAQPTSSNPADPDGWRKPDVQQLRHGRAVLD